MVRSDLLLVDRIIFKLEPDNELVTNICVKTVPIQTPIHLLSPQFEFLMKEIIILSQPYFNCH